MLDHSTSWTWVRHAPAAAAGRFCGQSNPPVEAGAHFGGVARDLPKSSAVFVSPLHRTMQTLEGLRAANFAAELVIPSPLIVEQNFGAMEGRDYASVRLPDDAESLAGWRPPQGESFQDVLARVKQFIAAAPKMAEGRDICVITHAGVIRAALAIALALEPGKALSLAIDPLSMTGIVQSGSHWQVQYVNRIAP